MPMAPMPTGTTRMKGSYRATQSYSLSSCTCQLSTGMSDQIDLTVKLMFTYPDSAAIQVKLLTADIPADRCTRRALPLLILHCWAE